MLQQSRKRSRKRPASSGGRGFTLAVLTLGGATAVCAAVLASGLTWPSMEAPLSLAAHHEKRADLALQGGQETPADLDRAALENDRTLAASPTTASAWLRAAYIQQQQTGALNAASLRNLETSYRVAPLGPGVSPWRLRFVFENWQSVTPAIRSAALTELQVFASYHKGSGALVDTIQNPAGRLAAKLTIRKVYLNIAAAEAGGAPSSPAFTAT